MNDIAIRVENLSKQYTIGRAQQRPDTLREALVGAFRRDGAGGSTDTFWALKDVSFEVKRGEVVGVIGRNGAGKSTLLKILSQITEPTSGRAEIHGRVGSLLEVGTGFHPELTGRENIYLNGAILGMRREEIQRRFDEIVAFAEIEKFLDTPVKRYSSGMYVRLAFAVAAHLEPEILLVDEVLAVGDAEFQRKALGKIKSVSTNDARTVVYVSHNLGSVVDICSRCLLLSTGELQKDGAPSIVVDHYLRTKGSNLAHVNLDNWHVDRAGNGPMRLRYLRTEGSQGNVSSAFAISEPIRFVIGVSGRKGKDCIVGIALRTASGQRVLHLSNIDDNAELALASDESEIVVLLDHNILNVGTYFVSVWLGDGTNILNDVAHECLQLEIANFGRSIKCLASVRVSASWSVREVWI
jgi:lipopolysaccharide transport system ATP-binding protein